MKESHKRNRNPAYKKKYRVTNWKAYEKSLRKRFSHLVSVSNSNKIVDAEEFWKARKTTEVFRFGNRDSSHIEIVVSPSS